MLQPAGNLVGIGDGGLERIALLADWHAVFASGREWAAVERQNQIRWGAFKRIQFLLGFLGQLWNRAQQRPGVRMLGVIENFSRGSALNNLTGVHNLN